MQHLIKIQQIRTIRTFSQAEL